MYAYGFMAWLPLYGYSEQRENPQYRQKKQPESGIRIEPQSGQNFIFKNIHEDLHLSLHVYTIIMYSGFFNYFFREILKKLKKMY